MSRGVTLRKKVHEDREKKRAERKAADRAERRAAKRVERVDSVEASKDAKGSATTDDAAGSADCPAPAARCAVCGFETPKGTLLFDVHKWPDGLRWVHRLCVGGSTGG